MASSIAANPLVTPSFLPRYADIKVLQTKGVVKLSIEFEMHRDRDLLQLVGNKLPDAENPIFLTIKRAGPQG